MSRPDGSGCRSRSSRGYDDSGDGDDDYRVCCQIWLRAMRDSNFEVTGDGI